MAVFQHPTIDGNKGLVSSKGGVFVSSQPRGTSFTITGMTGTIGAAAGSNSSFFSIRLDPGANTVLAYIQRIRIAFTCITAFTTPITANRRLVLHRGSGAAPSGGSLIGSMTKKDSLSGGSEFDAAQGGDIRFSTTAALTMTGVIFDTSEFLTLPLSHVGNAGNFIESVFDFREGELVVQPGQLYAIRNPVAMDAAGTFQLSITVDLYEEDSTTL